MNGSACVNNKLAVVTLPASGYTTSNCSEFSQALLAPAESIASKAGVDGEIVVEKTRTCNWQTGYNAITIRYEGLFSLELQILVGFQGVHFKLRVNCWCCSKF
nr:chaperonin 60 subunit alpha 2, chloroplastic [Quercus suber]